MVNRSSWSGKVAGWFQFAYSQNPEETMRMLLDHLFDIIRSARHAPAALNKVMGLGAALRRLVPDIPIHDLVQGRDQRILALLHLGLHCHHSHLFMLPQVYKSNLLEINEYSSLLLSTKMLASGDYDTALNLIQDIAQHCPLAQYIMGQSYRKRGAYQLALSYLGTGAEHLRNWSMHRCPFNKEFVVICDEHLLSAEIFRGTGVVFRKKREYDRAESYFFQAEAFVDKAIKLAEAKQDLLVELSRPPEDVVWADYERQSIYRVKADIFFSHGYHWYENRDYDRARAQFQEAICALDTASEQWDSPYTRLAIIELAQGNYPVAAELFTRAYVICSHTAIETNREAPLSKALCSLGLKVTEICQPGLGRLSIGDLSADLEEALSKTPRLAVGPLECHRDDAKHLLGSSLEPAHRIVHRFIERLDRAIDEAGV